MNQEIRRKLSRITDVLWAGGVTNPVTYNTPALVEKMLPSLQKAAGRENVSQIAWVTGAEDFAHYRTKAPAFFFYLGGMPKGGDPATAGDHHTPDFYIDDSRLEQDSPQHLPPRPTDRPQRCELASSLGDRDRKRVRDHEASDEERDPTEREQELLHDPE